MGYIVYVLWVVNIAGSLGSIGIPATVRKYMAEYIAKDDLNIAKWIYRRTLWIQVITATIALLMCMVWVMYRSPIEYRIAALILVFSIWPSMVNSISAQANVATENLSANLPASAAATVAFFVLTMLTVLFHWGVIGVAVAMFGMKMVDFSVRFVPTWRRINEWSHSSEPPPEELRKRMLRFAIESVAGMALTLIVWDRSEIVLLKYLSTDIRQIAFYSVAFSLAEKLLVFPTVFASATGVSVYAQYGRDKSRVPALTAAAVRYLGLTSVPLHFIAAALAGAALSIMYGKQYEGAIAVAMAAPILCLPKAFLTPIQTLFEAVEKQRYFIVATIMASIVDVAIAWLLIPRYGALGAAIGSGGAQMLSLCALWAIGIARYEIRLPWQFLGKITAISAIASASALVFVHTLPQLPGFLLGGIVSISIFIFLAAWWRTLEQQDLQRLKILVDACPVALATPANLTYSWLSRRVAPITEELI
ncbi:MAG: polysaccharide biosynthesis protein [Acidobacteria bacterium]|nr:polysaccharide biosynthesis protein [Acidobacteriota bacterium]